MPSIKTKQLSTGDFERAMTQTFGEDGVIEAIANYLESEGHIECGAEELEDLTFNWTGLGYTVTYSEPAVDEDEDDAFGKENENRESDE